MVICVQENEAASSLVCMSDYTVHITSDYIYRILTPLTSTSQSCSSWLADGTYCTRLRILGMPPSVCLACRENALSQCSSSMVASCW